MFRASAQFTGYRHVLIVDDVITTGATLESLARAIKAADPNVQISLLSFAFTK
jgi:predicted amidophosphoribosyltransferase